MNVVELGPDVLEARGRLLASTSTTSPDRGAG